ncbi:Nop53 (60S ribosomal biogenesis) family protein [Babesia bovis T2Bo]|uniref:Ribosome biogenesis protein NOP53 n=1 Tax=Babesia bovis TaxID=5865 RepID=A7ANP3_BABBO|nr:Nop53 (60S ribosomal biogenesis) family protein [Babesia bovis T2Bo]EDO08177.1 Nop53 (60S ribosomal biogenesis) family protein [Babesia bovis T2Bo]|eukprot:XP_001611745.1 hypothetical protein [Babesia bovis T2Bo]
MAPKKKWKRIDVSSVQESLFESNIAQNVAKGGLSEAMVIDTIGEAPSRRLAKKIKSQRHGDPIASRGTVERARLQKLVSRLKSERARMDIEENAPQGNERVIDDIWGDNAEPAAMLRPSMPTLAKVIPAVAAPHSGQSYNPSPEAREELINKAYESLPQEEDFSDEPLTDMIRECLPNVDVDNLTFRQKQVLGNLIIQDKLDESSIMEALAAADQEEVSEEEMDNTATANKRRVTTKKTRAKRNREKLHKASIAQALMRKRIKRLVHDIDHFKDTKHENDPLEIEEAKKERLRKYLQDLVKGRITPKFGNKVYRVDPPEVPLSDEVTSSLRQLASPSEASVRCVVDSIYRRGLVPAPPVIDEQYRSKARSKLLRRTRKFKSKLLHGTT